VSPDYKGRVRNRTPGTRRRWLRLCREYLEALSEELEAETAFYAPTASTTEEGYKAILRFGETKANSWQARAALPRKVLAALKAAEDDPRATRLEVSAFIEALQG